MKRRDFLSAGVAGIVAAPILSAADPEPLADNSDADVVRVAIVGCGRQGRAIINAGLKIESLRFVAVCDIQPTAVNSARLYLESEDIDVAAYADCYEMIEKERGRIDAVIVASPDFCHCDHTVAALQAGLHVYCDAPMATDAESARAMIAAARLADRLLQIGFERRSDPRYIHAAENLVCPDARELLLGTTTHFETQANRRVHTELAWPERDTLSADVLNRFGYESMREYRNWKQFSQYGHGSCAVYLAQQLDVMQWFFGVRPSSVQAIGGHDYYKYGDCIDNVSALLSYPFPDATVRGISRVWTTTSGGGRTPFEHFFGDLGSLQTSLSEGDFRLHAEPGLAKWNEFIRRGDIKKENVAAKDEDPNLIKVRETGNVVPYLLPITRPDSVIRLHIENFVRAAQGKETLQCSGEDAFPAHVIAWTICESAKTGRPTELDDAMFVV
ncbi:MAG: Gfo/Idh/MocA family protein [Thermoguttaceae bacterium]